MSVKRQIRLDSVGARVARLDVHRETISNIEITQQGFLRIPATVTRIGVFTYRRFDGTIIRELRSGEEVHKKESLDTLMGVPVTIDHPGLVTPGNVADFQVGFTGESIEPVGDLVNGFLTVQRADAIAGVQSKKLKEISPGYTCIVDPTPGVFNGERYDQKQTSIVYNHVALGEPGWGRQGPEVSLRTDAAVSGIENLPTPARGIEEKRIMETKIIRITLDGVPYELEIPAALAPTLEASINKVEKERNDAKEMLAKTEGEKAVVEKELKETKERLDSATKPEAIEKIVTERVAVIAKAKVLAPKLKMDGLTLDEIRKEALVVSGYKRETLDSKESGLPGFVAGVFEFAKTPEIDPTTVINNGFPVVNFHQDSNDDDDDGKKKEQREDSSSDAAYQRMCERNRIAWEPKN